MKTNRLSHFIGKCLFNRKSENEVNDNKDSRNSGRPLPDKTHFREEFSESANDKDFQEIFPHLKSAEKRFFQNKNRDHFSKIILVIILFTALTLAIVVALS